MNFKKSRGDYLCLISCLQKKVTDFYQEIFHYFDTKDLLTLNPTLVSILNLSSGGNLKDLNE